MTVRINKPALNVREELSKLNKPSGVAGEAMLRAETPQEQFNLIGAGRKNLIINGDFQISQRGDYSSATAFSADNYYVDRWQCLRGTVTGTVQQTDVTVDGASAKAVKVVSTGAGAQFMGIRQHVEFANIPVGKELTASMWVRTNTPYTRFRTNTFSGNAQQSPAFPNDEQWHKVTWTLQTTGTTTNGDLMVCFYGDSGLATLKNGDYIEFTQVQLELGSVATPFEHRSYGEELALCQRYFTKITFSQNQSLGAFANWNNTTHYGGVQWPTIMRTAPAVSHSNTGFGTLYNAFGATKAITSVTLQNSGSAGCEVVIGHASASQPCSWWRVGTIEFYADAEL